MRFVVFSKCLFPANLCFINSEFYDFMLCATVLSWNSFLFKHFQTIWNWNECVYIQACVFMRHHGNIKFSFLSFDEFTMTLVTRVSFHFRNLYIYARDCYCHRNLCSGGNREIYTSFHNRKHGEQQKRCNKLLWTFTFLMHSNLRNVKDCSCRTVESGVFAFRKLSSTCRIIYFAIDKFLFSTW